MDGIYQHTENEILSLGGVEFNEDGFLGHSDGDILLHALCDAFLGAVGKKTLVIIFHQMKIHQKTYLAPLF